MKHTTGEDQNRHQPGPGVTPLGLQTREAGLIRRRAAAKAKAKVILGLSAPAQDHHAYLLAKGVKSYGLRCWKDRLVVPMYDAEGELHSLQLTSPLGDKSFLSGGRTQGCYFTLGCVHSGDTILVAEGYATAATVYEITGHPVVVAFNAGNLLPVARTLRAHHPNARIVFCADDDAWTKGNPGVRKAIEAALMVGGYIVVPDFGEARPQGATDFNDMVAHLGKAVVTDFFADRSLLNSHPRLRAVNEAYKSEGARLTDHDGNEPGPAATSDVTTVAPTCSNGNSRAKCDWYRDSRYKKTIARITETTMTKHPADERLEADLAIAEETLLNVGQVMPSFIIMAFPQKRLLVPAPAEQPDTKAIYYSLIRLLCYAENAFAVTQVAECWMRFEGWRDDQSTEENAARARKIRPSQAPDRREVLVAATCYRGDDRKLALALRMREIIRAADGRPTGTAPMSMPEGSTPYEAALTQLLPPAVFSADQQQAARLELTRAQIATGIYLQHTTLPDFPRP